MSLPGRDNPDAYARQSTPALGTRTSGWPGLSHGNLVEGDVAVTNDYRSVLAEVVRTRFGADVSKVFPGFHHADRRDGGVTAARRGGLTAGKMDDMTLSVVAVQRTIHAEPARIFELLADPTKHAVIDGSGSVREVTSSTPRLALGSTFAASMQLGLPYRVTSTVVEFEENRRIAWRHFAGHRWRYVLTRVADGTLVREEWDASRLAWPAQQVLKLTGFPDRNRRGMEETLRRLEAALDGSAGPA